MIIAIDPNETFDYVLKRDRKDEHPTVFSLRGLNSAALRHLQDGQATFDNGGQWKVAYGTQTYHVLRYGLRGARGMQDSKGNEVLFEAEPKTLNVLGVQVKDPVSERFLDRLPPWCKMELSEAIQASSVLTEDEEKN